MCIKKKLINLFLDLEIIFIASDNINTYMSDASSFVQNFLFK